MKHRSIQSELYFIRDVEQIIRRDRLTLRRWWQKNKFPKPTLINSRLAWHSQVIEQWINQNVQGVQYDD